MRPSLHHVGDVYCTFIVDVYCCLLHVRADFIGSRPRVRPTGHGELPLKLFQVKIHHLAPIIESLLQAGGGAAQPEAVPCRISPQPAMEPYDSDGAIPPGPKRCRARAFRVDEGAFQISIVFLFACIRMMKKALLTFE